MTNAPPEQEPPRDRATAHYEADDPLTEQILDSFGRWHFSASIGDRLATRPEKTILVVGIDAPWADVKTSVLNFIAGIFGTTPHGLRIRYTLALSGSRLPSLHSCPANGASRPSPDVPNCPTFPLWGK